MRRLLIADCIIQKEFNSPKGRCVLTVLGISAMMTARVVNSVNIVQRKGCMPYLYPFISSTELMRFIICGAVILLFSDAPFWDNTFPYTLIRTGKKQWIKGIMAFIVLTSLLLSLLLLGASVAGLLPNLSFGSDWGDAIRKLSLSGYISGCGTAVIIDETIVNKYSPITSVLICFLLQSLLFIFMGAVSVCLNMLFSKILGIVVPVFFVVFSSFTQWALNKPLFYLSPVSWMNINEILGSNRDYYPSLQYIISFYLLGILISYFCICIYIQNNDISTENN